MVYQFQRAAAIVKKIASVPGAQMLNGMTTVQQNSRIVLMADSAQGAIYSLNIDSGVYQVAFQSPLFTPTSAFPLGMRGDVRHRYDLRLLRECSYQRPWHCHENATIISTNTSPITYDDFAIDTSGNAWISNHPSSLNEVIADGT